ncbi:MAG: acyl-CoA thioesterase [Xanthomonadaceae bacterium]|nr:acyl-CoA thioesterase [Xanthomonadaceae bacterium]
MTAHEQVFRTPIPLRWSDMDGFHHVNNARYLTFLEQARIEWFETIGEAWVTEDYAPVVASATLNFKRPIEYPAQVFVELFTERLGNSSVVIGHRIVASDGTLHCDGNIVAVWIDRRSGKSTTLPDCVRRAAAQLVQTS